VLVWKILLGFCRPFQALRHGARFPEPKIPLCQPLPLHSASLPSAANVSYLSDEACTHRVHIDHYLFTKSPSSRNSFPDWATPVKLCSIVICMLIDCRLHQFLSSIQNPPGGIGTAPTGDLLYSKHHRRHGIATIPSFPSSFLCLSPLISLPSQAIRRTHH